MTKTYTEQIEELFNSKLTSYSIAKSIGSSPQFVDNYRTSKAKVENMALGKAEALIEYWEEKKMEAYKDLKEFLDLEYGTVKEFDVDGLLDDKQVEVDPLYKNDKIILSAKELDIDHKDVYMTDYLNQEIYVYKIA